MKKKTKLKIFALKHFPEIALYLLINTAILFDLLGVPSLIFALISAVVFYLWVPEILVTIGRLKRIENELLRLDACFTPGADSYEKLVAMKEKELSGGITWER